MKVVRKHRSLKGTRTLSTSTPSRMSGKNKIGTPVIESEATRQKIRSMGEGKMNDHPMQ